MKRAIFSFFLLAVTQCSFAQWVSEYNDSLSQYLLPEFERISFSSPEVGVGACADTLGSGFSNNISSLVFTSDSGKSWRTTFFLDSFRIWDVEFITNNMVMAVGHRIRGSSIANKNGIICTSLDSGQTWSIQYFNEYLKYVEKVDSVKTIVLGYAAVGGSSQSKLLTSIDTGLTWTYTTLPSEIGDIYFVNNTLGFLNWSDGKILKSENSGVTWDTVTVSNNPNDIVLQISSPSLQKMHALIWNSPQNELKHLSTVDTGKTWQFVSSLNQIPFVSRMYFVSDNVGFILSEYGVYKTNDGGVNWFRSPANIFINRYLLDLHYFDTNLIYVSGINLFLRTLNGGDTIVATSLQENKAPLRNSLHIYPNPAKEQLFVQYKGKERLQIQLYNLVGQAVGTASYSTATTNKYRVSLANLPKGIYLLQVSTKEEWSSLRIIVE